VSESAHGRPADHRASLGRPELAAFGTHLRVLRHAAGKTQTEVADAGGLHFTYIGQVERGERNPSFLNVLAHARGLGLTIEELFRGFDPTSDAPLPPGDHRAGRQQA
jgi:transcriptional regulator with XRE-family HTH domain